MSQIKKLFLIAMLCITSNLIFADTTTVNFLISEYNRSFNLEVQQQTIKTLGQYSQLPASRNILTSTIANTRLHPRLRAQAAQSISSSTTDAFILNTILRAHDNSRDVWLRSKLLETIYPAVMNDRHIRNVLMSNLNQNNDLSIQLASAFSLGKNLSDNSVKNSMIRHLDSSFLSPAVKVEIIKSFGAYINDSVIKGTLQRVALSPNQSQQVRSAATRVVATTPKTRSSRQLLFDILAGSNSDSVRAQAAAGLKFELQEEDVQWMRLSVDPRSGLKRNPFTKI